MYINAIKKIQIIRTMKVYVFQSVWKDGNKIEASIKTKVFDTKEKAEDCLNAHINLCKERLGKYYDEDDINVEQTENDYATVDACYYEDYCILSVFETMVE